MFLVLGTKTVYQSQDFLKTWTTLEIRSEQR